MSKSQSISIPCPKCGHKTAQLVADLARDPNFACGGCGRTIHADPTPVFNQAKDLMRKSLFGGKRTITIGKKKR